MRRRVDQACVEASLAMGMLPEGSGTLTNPDPYTYATADGCWLPALWSLTIDDAVDARTGEILRRYDPDALAYHTHDGKATSPGHLLVMVTVRSPYRKERVVLTTRLKSDHNPEVNRNDATIAVNAVTELLDRHPELRPRLVGLIYDMALSAADFDRLLDAGLIPVSKVPLTSKADRHHKTSAPTASRPETAKPSHAPSSRCMARRASPTPTATASPTTSR